jgi:hypothetical protein
MDTNNNAANSELEDDVLLDEEDLIVAAAATSAIAAALAVLNYSQAYYEKTPYHDSALSGIAWVLELLNGHPERIHRELGVHKLFRALLITLQEAGYRQSKFVMLEEQLAIFLYICVTGLSLRHVCEHFQRASETASKYVIPRLIHIIVTDNWLQVLPQNAHLLFFSPVLH